MDPNSVNPTIPTAPTVPEAPAQPAVPAAPAAPATPTAPVSATPTPAASAMPEMPTPVAPVVNPTGAAPEAPTMPAMPAMPETPATPVAPVFQPSGANPMLGATDPITMPNPPKAPDPIEEELKAPMKAAGPVPGSIGSAISMPSEQPAAPEAVAQMGQVPNVAFNDPAAAQGQPAQAAPVKAAKKNPFGKLDKKSLIMLCAIAGIVVIALVVVLISMMN